MAPALRFWKGESRAAPPSSPSLLARPPPRPRQLQAGPSAHSGTKDVWLDSPEAGSGSELHCGPRRQPPDSAASLDSGPHCQEPAAEQIQGCCSGVCPAGATASPGSTSSWTYARRTAHVDSGVRATPRVRAGGLHSGAWLLLTLLPGAPVVCCVRV